MASSPLSELERIQQQPTSEWWSDYENAGVRENLSPKKVIAPPPTEIKNQDTLHQSLKEAGIASIRRLDSALLINIDRHLSSELDSRIKNHVQRLIAIAEPCTGENLYLYMGYRTFFKPHPFLALIFKNIRTGEIAERYFNIVLTSKQGKSFKTGNNGKFHIVGNINRPTKGMFIKFWLDVVKCIPDNRPSHIYRYMNSKLAGVIVSCSDTMPHHDFIKLTDIKYEGHLYDI